MKQMPYARPPPEHAAGDEVQERQQYHLVIVGGAAARRQTYDLKCSSKLDCNGQRWAAPHQACGLNAKQGERTVGAELTQPRVRLVAVGYHEGECGTNRQQDHDVTIEGAGGHYTEQPERRQSVGHHAVNATEPHALAPGATGVVRGAAGSTEFPLRV